MERQRRIINILYRDIFNNNDDEPQYSYDYIKNILPKSFKMDEIELKKLNESSHDNCIICLENYKINDKTTYLPCFHIFHENCLIEWFRRKNNCPLCKKDYNFKNDNLNENIIANNDEINNSDDNIFSRFQPFNNLQGHLRININRSENNQNEHSDRENLNINNNNMNDPNEDLISVNANINHNNIGNNSNEHWNRGNLNINQNNTLDNSNGILARGNINVNENNRKNTSFEKWIRGNSNINQINTENNSNSILRIGNLNINENNIENYSNDIWRRGNSNFKENNTENNSNWSRKNDLNFSINDNNIEREKKEIKEEEDDKDFFE